MKQTSGGEVALLWAAGCLLLATLCQDASAQCSTCAEEQKVIFKLRGVGIMAGTATARVTWGDTVVEKEMISTTATIVWNPDTQRYEPTGFDCVQWDAQVVVDPKLNEPVKIEYFWETDDQNPTYAEFEALAGTNPTTYWTRPSSECLKIWFDQDDGNWVPASDYFSFTDTIRMKGTLVGDDSNIGDSHGPIAGGGMPVVDDARLTDAPNVREPCAGQGMMEAESMSMETSSASAGEVTEQTVTDSPWKLNPRGQSVVQMFLSEWIVDRNQSTGIQSMSVGRGGMVQSQPVFDRSNPPTTVAYSDSRETNVRASGTPEGDAQLLVSQSLVGLNGVSIADPVGRLRWEMSLGSVGRSYTLGKLVYQANVLDASAYSPGRLRLASGSDPSQTITDSEGVLRQILVAGQLVDIPATTHGFQVAVYPAGEFDSYDSQLGLFPATGIASLIWLVENPDASPLGKVRFTRTRGTNSEVHEARWQGTAGDSGTMTILRFDGKWKEETEYSLHATQRIETVSSYKDNVLERKVRNVYQEFYNWGEPGDIHEAIVQRVEDPDGQALTSTFVYWDQPSQPGNLLFRATHPDGYAGQIPNRISGSGIYPVLVPGEPVRLQRTFKDNDAGTADGEMADITYTTYTNITTLLSEKTVTWINGKQVGYQFRKHHFDTPGLWRKITYESDGADAYTYEEQWQDLTTRKTIFSLDRNGTTRIHYHGFGYWNPATQTLDGSPSYGTVAAFSTTIVHGTLAALYGTANKTTVNFMVEDRFGHTVLEETYVSDGTGATSPSRLIDRRVHTYTDGRLTATHANGRLVYQAGYLPDGLLDWEEDETGRRTEFGYDEMERMNQMLVRGRGGDADRVTTFDYDAGGRRVAEVTAAGGLTNQTHWVYNLAGELTALIGTDGLTNFTSNSYTSGWRVTTDTLPTGATRISSFFKDRQARSVTGTAVEDEFYDPQIVLSSGDYRKGVKVYRDSELTQLKFERQVNWLGNEVLAQTPRFKGLGMRERATLYDWAYDAHSNRITRGLAVAVTETGRADQLFTYDELARLSSQGMDLNGNGVLDTVSVEPITMFTRQFVNSDGVWQDMSEVWRFLQDNAAATSLAQRARVIMPATFPTNLVSSNIVERAGGGTVITTVELNHTTGELTSTVNDLELGQVRTRVQRDGLARSETSPGIATPRTYEYTALGELLVVDDPVTGGVTNSYDPATRRLTAVTDSLSRSTSYDYYPAATPNAGRVKGVQDPAGNWTYFDYTSRGETSRQWGVNTYPVEYGYDEAGRMTNMVTFRTAGNEVNWASATWPDPPGGDATTWVYDQPSGLLERKIYADAGTGAKAVDYSYDAGNFPDTKINARGQTIDYSFDLLGRMTSVAYSDGTPSATMGYDRAGRLRSVTDASGTRTLSWTDRDQIEDEVYTAGMLSGVWIDRTYDAQFRLERLEFKNSGVTQTRQRFAYDGISWLDYIADETPDGATVLNQFDYTFKSNTPFVESLAFLRGTTSVMTNRYSRDSLGRLTGVNTTLAGGGSVSGVDYQLDALDRRYRANLTDGTRWDYGYNDRSEVTSGKKKLASGEFEGGKQFEYGFDDIGNRTSAKAGGSATGANLRESIYTPNALNELMSRTVPGSVWITGEADTNLALQGIADGHVFAVERQEGERFFGEVQLVNDAAVYARVTVAGKTNGVLEDVESGNHFLASDPEAFVYDADGNLTQDGRWTYVWDAENRLVSVTARADVPDAAKRKVEWVYDYTGRRVRQKTYTGSSGTDVLQEDLKFVSDGWRNIAELNATNNALVRSYSWGLDLSGTLGGAGGVGGLLMITSAQNGTHYYAMDGSGNTTALVSAIDGAVSAHYEYEAFGVLLRATGTMALENPFRFSTKRANNSTGLVLYEYRAYSPAVGRWLSLDPLGQQGGVNLYGFVYNSAVNYFDPLGLIWYEDLAAWAQREHAQFSTAMNAASGDGVNWIIAGSLNTASELAAGILSFPNAIGHLGEATGATGYIGDEPLFQPIANLGTGAGTFCGNPSWETASGALMDLSVTAAILAPFAPKGRTIYAEPNGQLVFPYYAEMSPARLSVLKGSPVLGVEGVNSALARQRLLQLELDFRKALCECGAKGRLTGSLDGLTAAERSFVNELLAQSKNVDIIPRGAGKTADFLINGIDTELKTLATAGPNTLKNAIETAALQGKQIVIDARNVGITPEAATAQIQRAQGNIGGLQGRVTVLTSRGPVNF